MALETPGTDPGCAALDTLPVGRAPAPVGVPHFPDALHAVVWRNWDVIDVEVLARLLRATPPQLMALASAMGLPPPRRIPAAELRRNYMTVLQRNWHLLPYEQICQILGWDATTMRFALNEDDCMWIKLGGYKPRCLPVYYHPPTAAAQTRAQEIGRLLRDEMGDVLREPAEPLFGFIGRFCAPGVAAPAPAAGPFQIRMAYPYFLRYGDPLLGNGIEDVPESYLARLAAQAVNAIWIQGVLKTLAPWDLAPELSHGWQERLANLDRLVQRCRRFGIEVLLYLNEPRAMPRSFFARHPELRGVEETPARAPSAPDVVALCTSTRPVQEFLVNTVRQVFTRVPGLGGIFTITYSENLTNCYSREYDSDGIEDLAIRSSVEPASAGPPAERPRACPRCAARGPEVINAEVCTLLERGMRLAGSSGKFMLCPWSTPAAWVPGIVERLPESTWLLCLSEWGKRFTRGDYTGTVNEYSISVVGPSEQSLRQWDLARRRGLRTVAKLQVGTSSEFLSIPYIPALRLVAEHLSNLVAAGVDGLMLGWTAGGSPSPSLELAAEFARSPRLGVHEALLAVARSRFGAGAADDVVQAWNVFSDAYSEFPFDLAVCYYGPQSRGPANLLFAEPTGLAATMVTFPFDDVDGWRGPYSRETFERQFERVASAWAAGVEILERVRRVQPSAASADEWRIAEAARIHFRSTANQARFVRVRQSDPAAAAAILRDEMALARQLLELVRQDSRIGFEATNQYGYTRYDLAEKVLNCQHLLAALAARGGG